MYKNRSQRHGSISEIPAFESYHYSENAVVGTDEKQPIFGEVSPVVIKATDNLDGFRVKDFQLRSQMEAGIDLKKVDMDIFGRRSLVEIENAIKKLGHLEQLTKKAQEFNELFGSSVQPSDPVGVQPSISANDTKE